MSDLSQRLRCKRPTSYSLADPDVCLCQKCAAANALDAKDAEIERLRDQLSFMTRECQKFEAVVDAAKAVIPHAKGQVYDGVKVEFLEEALAALKETEEPYVGWYESQTEEADDED